MNLPTSTPIRTNSFSVNTQKKGFSLIEVLIAVSIIAIIAAIGITTYGQGQRLARDSRRKEDLKGIQSALSLYYQDNKNYPTAASWLSSTSEGTWITGLTTNYISAVPQDPINSPASCTINSSATCYRYGYIATNGGGASCPAAGQYYVLGTNLENDQDPEANRNKGYKHCDGAFIAGDPSLSNSNMAFYAVISTGN